MTMNDVHTQNEVTDATQAKIKSTLYILKPIDEDKKPWKPWYDRMFGVVVCAGGVAEARKWASEECGDEGKDAWLNSKLSSCEPLTSRRDHGVVIRNFASA